MATTRIALLSGIPADEREAAGYEDARLIFDEASLNRVEKIYAKSQEIIKQAKAIARHTKTKLPNQLLVMPTGLVGDFTNFAQGPYDCEKWFLQHELDLLVDPLETIVHRWPVHMVLYPQGQTFLRVEGQAHFSLDAPWGPKAWKQIRLALHDKPTDPNIVDCAPVDEEPVV